MNPLLALDFDGVICNSEDECLVSALNALARLRGKQHLLRSTTDIDPDLVQRFRAHRHLVRSAGEYETLVHWLTTREDAPKAESLAAAAQRRAAEVIAFQPIFSFVRTALRSADPTAWAGLHRLYPEAAAGWDEVCATHEVHVVTAKDLASIRHLDAAWRLGLSDDRLHTCERFVSKAGAIRQLAGQHGVRPSEVTFIDDHPDHLADVAGTGACCLWAKWGCVERADGWPALRDLASLAVAESAPA